MIKLWFSESFRSFCKIFISLREWNRHLSSANRKSFTLGDEICKSFTYNRNIKVSKALPRETPHEIVWKSEKHYILFLLLVVYVRGKIEIIPEQYLIHHNNPTYKISWFTLSNAFAKCWKIQAIFSCFPSAIIILK